MNTVFVVQHVHLLLPQEEEDVKLIGVYRSLHSAQAAARRMASAPGFRDHPDIVDSSHAGVGAGEGFHISEYRLDEDNWTSGYVTQVN
ncbi:DUF7336 domain-containing protein [Variovorax atrisoli]|uniref:DUF7336 domain-containing protein n=1 Tax=Variovorax atrisoli TaxID=3394203 RepID=UPI0009B73F77|nr:hypothetical protein [Variovorax paradoxus]